MVTDAHPEVLRRLRHNAEANGGQDSVEVRELDWATFGEEGSEELGQLVRGEIYIYFFASRWAYFALLSSFMPRHNRFAHTHSEAASESFSSLS